LNFLSHVLSFLSPAQDAIVFRRKNWQYLILDEAHNIKNFKSQRWQVLLSFKCTHRLLLTGTPLQNNLIELWSLMHFLMPHIFASQREFKEWFNPVSGMIEGKERASQELIDRLHGVLRPFLLRRLKCDVAKQLPPKFEHALSCRLSKRQRQLYDEFMANADTRKTLQSGNYLGLMNILMQVLFEFLAGCTSLSLHLVFTFFVLFVCISCARFAIILICLRRVPSFLHLACMRCVFLARRSLSASVPTSPMRRLQSHSPRRLPTWRGTLPLRLDL
jgi:SNF2 family DNA or RNA helicase